MFWKKILFLNLLSNSYCHINQSAFSEQEQQLLVNVLFDFFMCILFLFCFCTCVEHLQEIILIKTWTSALVIALWFGWLEHLESVMDFLLVFFPLWSVKWNEERLFTILLPSLPYSEGLASFEFIHVHCFHFELKNGYCLTKSSDLFSSNTPFVHIQSTSHIFFKRSFMQLNLDFKKEA